MINKTHEMNHWIHGFILTMESVKPSRKWFSKFIFGALLSCSTVASWIRTMKDEHRYKKAYHQLRRLGAQKFIHKRYTLSLHKNGYEMTSNKKSYDRGDFPVVLKKFEKT